MTDTLRHAELIDECERYCREHGISETTFGRKAVNDGKFLLRLKGGGRVWPETEFKARLFIAQSKPPEREHEAPSTETLATAPPTGG